MKLTLTRYFLLLIFCYTSLPSAFSQHISFNDMTFVRKRQKKLTLSFKLINNLIILPVQINDSDTMNFIVDTGVNSTIITELSLSNTLSLNYARKTTLRGLGEGEDLEALHSFGNNFTISGIKGKNQHVFMLLEDVFHLSTKLGMRVQGIIGYSLFRDFVVSINYERQKITFTKPKKFKPTKSDLKKAIVLPLKLHKTKPYLEAEIVQTNDVKTTVKLFLDTGASHALWLDASSNENISIPEKSIESYLGRGLNGEIHGKIGRIKSIQLGEFILKDVITVYPDTSSTNSTINLDDRNGSLGSEILKRFRVSIDYSRQEVTLRPNSSFEKDFDYNMSGIEISAPIPEMPYFVISGIRENSPANRVGLLKGDQILWLNNHAIKEYSLSEINDLFHSKNGKKIKITVQRDTKVIKREFVLEKII